MIFCGCGGTGRRDRLKIDFFTECRFDSCHPYLNGSLVQWLERRAHNAVVVGSNPTRSTNLDV